MKPKTKIQKEVARLSANLRPISATQIDWAYRHCVEHIGYRTKNGNITCSDCGHEWHSDSGLCDTLEGCTCPKCHAELKVQDTRRRIYKETQNFSVITTCKGYQVIRVAQVRCESRKGEPMRFYCHEVVQRWISPDGKVTDMALLRGFLFCYCDVWALGSDMEVRPHNSLYDDVVARSCAYPKMRILPQLRRNGFKGDFHGISPVRLFKALLSDPRIETLMKGGEIEVMKHFLFNTRTADECWASYLIAKRHKYQIDNLSMWCDYLRMLKKLGQDLRNPKNICPEDFMAAHDNATRKTTPATFEERIAKIKEVQRGWLNYFQGTSILGKLRDLDGWLRNRLRYCIWHHWKKPERKRKNLIRLGVDQDHAYAWSRTRKGGWAIAQSPILGTTITLQRLKKRGYVSLTELHLQLNPSLCEPPST